MKPNCNLVFCFTWNYSFIQKGLLKLFILGTVVFGFSFNVVSQEDRVCSLPLFVFDTNGDTIIDEPKVHVRLKIIDNVHKANSPDDDPNVFLGYAGIELRGFTSLNFKKKQYDVELRDSLGNERSVSLLGMPKESDWVLNGPYTDKSLIRNALLYELARGSNVLTPRTRFCELIINNEYLGVYVLTEKIKRDKNRVNIFKQDTLGNTDGDVSGGVYS